MTTTRRGRWIRWLLIAFGVILVLPVLGVLAFLAMFDAEALRPRLVAAAERATGRDVEVGSIGLAISLRPTVVLTDVSLANAPWGSRPQMLTARRVEVQMAVLPLLSRRVEIGQVTLDGPDLLLETNQQGLGNWVFAPQPAPDAAPSPAPTEPAPGEAGQEAGGQDFAIAVDSLRLTGGQITWRNGQTGRTEQVRIAELTGAAPGSGPLRASGRLTWRGQEASFRAEGASLAALRGGGASAVPLTAEISVAGAEARVSGEVGPGEAWQGTVSARAAELARLAPLLPDVPLPPLRDVALDGRFAGKGGEVTAANDVRLTLGAADLSLIQPGLQLGRAELATAALNAPLRLSGQGQLQGMPVAMSGEIGAPAILLGRQPGPLPVNLQLQAGEARATLQGAVREPRELTGVDLRLEAAVPNLAALAPQLPPVRDLRANARIAERGPRFEAGAFIRDLAVTSSAGDLGGELTVVIGERPALAGRVASRRLDLDALMAPGPSGGAAPAPGGTPAVPARPALPQGGRAAADANRVIPDTPLPFALLRTAEADLNWTAAEVQAGGQPWREVALRLAISNGRGGVDPLTFVSPAGPARLEIEGDATQQPPALHVVLTSPGMDLGAVQRLAGQAPRVSGMAEIEADLRGRGADLRAQAASLGGHLGIAMLGGHVEPALVQQVQEAIRRALPLPLNLPQRLPLECVAVRAEAENGVARVTTLLVDAPAAKAAGSGQVNLGSEALALELMHDVRTAAGELRIGANLGGTLAAPSYNGVRIVGGMESAVGNLLGRSGSNELGALLGALGGQRPQQGAGGLAPLPECGPALTAARGGRQGPVPAARAQPQAQQPQAQQPQAQPEAAPAPQPAQPALPRAAEDLLRGLLRR